MSKDTKKEEVKDTKGIKIKVSDPEIARPKELPLVVKPVGGKWANASQEEFAATLNAYAYRNSEKWATKKDTLLEQLANLEKRPEDISLYRGNTGKVAYKNNLLGQ